MKHANSVAGGFRAQSKECGFALLPIILTVIIVGALVSVGIAVLAPRVKQAKYNQARDTMTAAIDAVISWSAANGRLPDSTVFPTVVRQDTDPWRKPLIYLYDGNLTTTATGGVCGRQTTGITAGAVTDIAFAIISGGDDYAVSSIPGAAGAFNGNLVAAATDIVRRVTLGELKTAAGCYGGTSGRLTILNNEMPRACSGQAYTAAVYAEQGVPFASGGAYKWCLKGTLPPGVTTAPNTPACPASPDCSSLGTEAAAQWSQANTLQLSGTPTAPGNYSLNVLVRDNNDNSTGTASDNCVQKKFQLAVAACGGGPTPISDWDFNEGSGSTVADGAGGNDGTLEGDTAWSGDTPEGTGSALQFDGAGDYVRIPNSSDLRITGELTLEAWIKEATAHPYAKVLSRRSGNYFYFLGVDNGRPYGGVGDGMTFAVTGKSLLMSLSTWNHLAFVYNDADDSMYIHFDGLERETGTALILPARAGVDLCIGADSGGSSAFFKGAIDQVAIYARALTAAEIRDIYSGTLAEPRVAYYTFDGNAADSSGNGHDGTVTGAGYTQDRLGNSNAALAFDGNDYVLVNDHPDLRLTGQLTLMAWVKETAPGTYAKVISRRAGNYFYFLGVDNGHPYGGIGDGTSYQVTRKSIDMPANLWHHIAFVYNQASGKIYLYYDGIVDKTDVTVILPDLDHVDLTIGGDNEGGSNFFEGLIDGVKIFDQSLTADEIRQTYK
jgi:type II secretory pathway pseudopilin PulG